MVFHLLFKNIWDFGFTDRFLILFLQYSAAQLEIIQPYTYSGGSIYLMGGIIINKIIYCFLVEFKKQFLHAWLGKAGRFTLLLIPSSWFPL